VVRHIAPGRAVSALLGKLPGNMVKKVFRAVCGTMIYAIEPSDKELAYVHVFDSVQISQLSSKRASRVDNLGLSQGR